MGEGPLGEADRNYGFDVYHRINVLKQQRVRLYTDLIRKIGNRMTIRMTLDKGWVSEQKEAVCAGCGYQRHQWMVDMMEAIQQTPRWEAFYAAFQGRSEKCSQSHRFHGSACTGWYQQGSWVVNEVKDKMIEKESYAIENE